MLDVKINRESFLNALKVACRVIGEKMPILSCAIISAGADRSVCIAATDLDVAIKVTLDDVAVLGFGKVALPAEHLRQIVAQLEGDCVHVKELDERRVAIQSGRARFRLVGHPAENFPELPKGVEKVCEVAAGWFARMAGLVAFAAAKDEGVRYALHGVQIELSGNILRMIAVDGHRLAAAEVACEDGNLDRAFLVPPKALAVAAGLIESERLAVFGDENHIVLRGDNAEVSARLVAGTFPDWSSVIPKEKELEKSIEVDADQFRRALKRMHLISSLSSELVRMDVNKDEILLGARDDEGDEAEERLVVTTEGVGEEIGVGYNGRYVLEFLSHVGDSPVRMMFKDGQTAAIFKPIGWQDIEYKYVLMPMRL